MWKSRWGKCLATIHSFTVPYCRFLSWGKHFVNLVFFFFQLAEVFQCSYENLTRVQNWPQTMTSGTSLSLFWPISLLAMFLLRCWFVVLKSGVNFQWSYLFQLSSPFISTIVERLCIFSLWKSLYIVDVASLSLANKSLPNLALDDRLHCVGFNSLTTVGYLLGVFFRLWIPLLVYVSTSAWSQHWKL